MVIIITIFNFVGSYEIINTSIDLTYSNNGQGVFRIIY